LEKDSFDIIVTGGGPAGIMAALHAARGGKRVLLIDRKKKIGLPVRCGEGIGIKGFEKSSSVKPEWVKSTITRLKLVAPSGTIVSLPAGFNGYIVSREHMERDMTHDAIKNGVKFLPDTTVIKAFRTTDGFYECQTTHGIYRCRCLILADGVESKLARDFGWNTSLKLKDIHTCAFARVADIEVENDVCVLFLGRDIAPGGYVWIFPRGNDCANIGLGINGIYSTSGKPKELLFDFITKRFPNARVTDVHCGGVPMNGWLRPLVKGGVMVVGDAARMMNCSTGAGINYALFAGKTAGDIAAQAINDNGCQYDQLKKYEKEWIKHFGKQQLRSYALKESMIHFSDEFISRVADSVVSQKSKKLNIVKIFLEAFSSHPILMNKAYKLFKH
jgi:digeranylgeranylglycerophospholipid reductase